MKPSDFRLGEGFRTPAAEQAPASFKRPASETLVWGNCCQAQINFAIFLFDPAGDHLLVPTFDFRSAPRTVTVKGDRRPSRSDLPLTATSTAEG